MQELPTVIAAVEFRREAYGLDCRQWSAVLGMSATHYSEFIHGKRNLPRNAMAAAYAYGVPADCLFQTYPDKNSSDIDRRLAELESIRKATGEQQ